MCAPLSRAEGSGHQPPASAPSLGRRETRARARLGERSLMAAPLRKGQPRVGGAPAPRGPGPSGPHNFPGSDAARGGAEMRPAGTRGLQGGAGTEFCSILFIFFFKPIWVRESKIAVADTPGHPRRIGCPSRRGRSQSRVPRVPREGAPCREQPGVEEPRSAGSLAWETRRRPPRTLSGDWLPFTADSQVPRRNFALHMRRPWLVQWRGWGRRPPGSVLGMAWGSAGKRRPTVSPIHTGRREMPGLHLQPRSRQPLLGPRASRARRRRPRSPLPAPRSPRSGRGGSWGSSL